MFVIILTRNENNSYAEQIFHGSLVPVLNSLLHVRIPDDIYRHVRLKRVSDEYSEREDKFDRLREARTKEIRKRQYT